MPLPTFLRSPIPGGSFRWLLASDALTLLSMMVGQVALPWWIAQSGGAHDLAVFAVSMAAMSFVAIAGVALAHAGVRTVYVAFGLASVVSALGFFLIPGLRAFMALEHDEVDNWYGRTYPKAFET
jgi:hypothetical protein